MTDKKTPEEVVAGIICDHFGDCMMIWKRHLEQAEEILTALKYHDLVALVLEKDKKIAELEAEIENQYELSAFKWSLE